MAETEARLKAVLAAAGQPYSRRSLTQIAPGVWRYQLRHADLALKLFNGPNAHERLATEAALYKELCRLHAPVPRFVAADSQAVALARAWAPGATLYRRLVAPKLSRQSDAVTVRDAWLRLMDALAPWNERISSERRAAARCKRRKELAAVAQAVAETFPSVPPDAIDALSRTAATGKMAVLPLDATPSNILIEGDKVTFIDLEVLGLDFTNWTLAKYVTAADQSGLIRSLAASYADDSLQSDLHASTSLLALARAAGLWDAPRISPRGLIDVLPDSSPATRRIREALGLESRVTSDSG